MKHLFSNKYILLLIRVVLAFIFIYAGIEKISNPENFSQSIANYKLLPIEFVNLMALILPWIEVVSGLLLLVGVSVKENSFILTFLLAVFIIAIVISLLRGLDITCGCFGTKSGSKIGLLKVLEDVGLFLLGIYLIVFSSDYLSIENKSTAQDS
jgi:putative oxidoreductase